MAIFISSKFSKGAACQYDGAKLNYGENAFSSVAEAYKVLGEIYDEVVFADSKVTLTAKEMEMLRDSYTIYGKAEVYSEEDGGYVYLSEYSNVKADSTLIIKDAPGNDYGEYPNNKNFSKVEVSNSSVGSIRKDAYYTSKISKEDSYGMVTENKSNKADGSVTVKDSSVGSVINYSTVNLTNSSAGAIICKQSYNSEAYGYLYEDEYDSWVETWDGGSYDIDYTVGGTLTVALDKNAERDSVYNIGGGDYWYGEESYRTFGVIDGYNKVTITGLDAAKNPNNSAYICVDGSIVGGKRELDYYYGESSVDMDSSGTVKISNGVEVRGAVAYFNSVTIAAQSRIGSIINGDGAVSVKYSFSKEENSESWYGTTYVMTVADTISLGGSVTVSDSEVGNITDYKTVKITNSDTGRIQLDNATRQIVEYRSEYELDEEYEDMSEPSKYTTYYTADGSLTFKVDKNAVNESYYIGRESEYGGFEGVGDYYDEYTPYDEISENKAVAGYKKVDIAGYTDKKNSYNNKYVYVYGDIVGGDAFSSYHYNGNSERKVYASGSATLSNVYTDSSNVIGFTTVKLTDSTVGKVDKMNNKATVKEKYETKDYYSYGYPEKSKYLVVTETVKSDGSFDASNSKVNDSINNYQTVNLLNSTASGIKRDMLSKVESEYQVYEGEYGDSDYVANDAAEIEKEYIAAGSVTVKLDKNAAEDNYYVGDIEGYANVNLTGYTDKKDSSNNKRIDAGSISGGSYTWEYENYYEKYDDQEVAGSVKLDNVRSGRIGGFNTVALNNAEVEDRIEAVNGYRTTTFGGETDDYMMYGSMTSSGTATSNKFVYKSADKVTVAASQVSGYIQGYGNVSLTDSYAEGIILGEAYTEDYKLKMKGNSVTDTWVYTATKTAAVTLKNSTSGYIEGYSKVTLVNSSASDIYQSTLVKVTATGEGDPGASPYNGTWEYKTTGSISITADKNASQDNYYVYNISGYEKVTISGYEGKDGKDVFITTGNIYGGASVAEGEVYMMNSFSSILEDGSMMDRKYYTSGSVTLQNNVRVEGDIYGYDKVTLTDADVYSIYSQEYYGESDMAVGSSVTLNSSSVSGTISGYKNVSIAKGVNYISDYYGSVEADKLTVAKGATLKISNLYLGDNDKLEIKGTVVFEGGTWDVAGDQISGSGEIAATRYALDYIDLDYSSKVKLVNLGETSTGFVSSAAEAADDTAKKAVKWDGSENYNGWLSGGGDGVLKDTVDYIKLTAQEDGMLWCGGSGEIQLLVNGKKWDGSERKVFAGTTYTIQLERKESDSASYELGIAEFV